MIRRLKRKRRLRLLLSRHKLNLFPKKAVALASGAKGQFSEIRYISKEVYRIFAFVSTNAVLVRKNR